MTIKRISPKEASQLVEADHKYVDVRSVPEFSAGHPKGAYNIPLMHFAPGSGMSPNPQFADVFQKHFGKDDKIVLGCKAGGRSLKAAEMLGSLGYVGVVDMLGGFDGQSDPGGKLIEPGWTQCDLPTETGSGGRGWDDLK